jgi:hypothetical protein
LLLVTAVSAPWISRPHRGSSASKWGRCGGRLSDRESLRNAGLGGWIRVCDRRGRGDLVGEVIGQPGRQLLGGPV